MVKIRIKEIKEIPNAIQYNGTNADEVRRFLDLKNYRIISGGIADDLPVEYFKPGCWFWRTPEGYEVTLQGDDIEIEVIHD